MPDETTDRAIDKSYFHGLLNVDESQKRITQRISAIQDSEQLTRFFTRYAAWNGRFANGVSALASLIGDQRDQFREEGFPRAVADRSNYIASYIFDAARDEYDDHINPIRDTHRCMAQASLISMTQFYGLGDNILDEAEPLELQQVNEAVLPGYTGLAGSAASGIGRVFSGIGFHLGSELLADREFSIIDEYLRSQHNELVQHLMRSTVQLAGGAHRCYAWVGVHSGHGGGVEAEHFDYALEGAHAALKYLVDADLDGRREEAMDCLAQGFLAFERNHAAFFSIGE